MPFPKIVALAACLIAISSCSANNILSSLNATLPDGHYQKTKNLPYGKHARQKMDLYLPASKNGQESRSSGLLVVFIHGGAWRTGSKDEYEFVAQSLTRDGHTVLIPNYRLYPSVVFPEFVSDIAQAIATYEQLSLTSYKNTFQQSVPEKIIVMGHSSGAHQAALLTTDASYLKRAGVKGALAGLIGLSGPYDLPLDTQEVTSVFPNVTDETLVNPVLQVLAFTEQRTQSDQPLPPTLLLHGKKDERVTITHTRKFASALETAGVPVTVSTLRGGHARAVVALASPLKFLNDALDDVEGYLQEISDI